MKRARAIGILLLIGLFTIPLTANAAGRLNFMLTNMTGIPITSIRIAPTGYPEYGSENLLKTTLEPNTRLYIGPNYYGQNRYWNIELGWSNGATLVFSYNQLTRYNSYVVYANAYGARMRQGYEPMFARYEDSGYTPSYMSGDQARAVAVGAPEKVNASAPAVAQSDSNLVASNSKRKTRDLVFDDEEESANKSVSTSDSGDAAKGDTISVKATVELTRGDKVSTVLPSEEFKSGDRVRLVFTPNRDGRVYWLAKGTSGQYQVLFPSQKAGMDNAISKNREYTVPAKGAWKFDDNKGTETLVCILSPNAVDALDNAVKLASEGKAAEASRAIDQIVNGHESKRKTRDLVFEEENEDDVNTKSQVAAKCENFVATYELSHN